MRTLGGDRARVARVVTGLVLTAATLIVVPSRASADPLACTYDGAPTVAPGVAPSQVITISCTGLAPSQSVVVNEETPLAPIVQPVSSATNEMSTTPLAVSADATGALSTTFTLPAPFTALDPGASCPPTQAQVNAGLAVCSLTIRDAATQTLVVPSVPLVYAGQPTPTVTPAVNVVNGTSFVDGDIVTFAGSGFWGSPAQATPTVLFNGSVVATPLPLQPVTISPTTYVCATDCNGAAGTLTSGGVVTGSVTVPTGLPAGPIAVDVLQTNTTPFPGNGPFGSVAAGSSIAVLGAPTATASPASGGPGTPVQVTGTGWDPQGPAPQLTFLTLTQGAPPQTPTTALVDAAGNMSGIITVTGADQLGPNPIVVTQGTRTTQASYTVTDITSTCVGTSCVNNQVITQQIGQGGLTLSEQGSAVTLTAITLDGAAHHSTGTMSPITVNDDRGTLVGWTVTGTLSGDFVNQTSIGAAANNMVPASNLTWIPSVTLTSPGSGDLSQAHTGTPGALSKTVGQTLCWAPPGGGGGSYSCSALLDLLIPASVAAGRYTATLNITIT